MSQAKDISTTTIGGYNINFYLSLQRIIIKWYIVFLDV